MQIIFVQLVTCPLMSYRVSYANNILSDSYQPINESQSELHK
jgi:hypothetical protein